MRHAVEPSTRIVPAEVAAVLERVLGAPYRTLVDVAFDLAAPPMFMALDSRERIRTAWDACSKRLKSWEIENRTEAQRLSELVPKQIRRTAGPAALIVAAVWDACVLPPDLDLPDLSAPVFASQRQLKDRLDDDGLLPVEGLDTRPNGILHGELAIHYHQVLGRDFCSQPRAELINALLAVEASGRAALRVAVDEMRVRYRDEYQEPMFKDYWYGPKLDNDRLDERLALGETFHGDPEQGQSLLNPYVGTSFRWTAAEQSMKTIEIEELVPVSSCSGGQVYVRYLHAIRDTERREFVHCDGAVKAYGIEGYPQTPASFASRGRAPQYRKAFRLDGAISADEWSEISALWFSGNGLVQEYLESLG